LIFRSPSRQIVKSLNQPTAKSRRLPVTQSFCRSLVFPLSGLSIIYAGAWNSGWRTWVVSFSTNILPLRGIGRVCHFIIREQWAGFLRDFYATIDSPLQDFINYSTFLFPLSSSRQIVKSPNQQINKSPNVEVTQSPRPKVSYVRHFQTGKFSNFSNPQPERTKKNSILSRKKWFQTYMCLLGIKKAWKECPTTFLISLFPVKG
jgi:hypothetical protein